MRIDPHKITGVLLAFLLADTLALAQSAPNGVIVRFARGALEAPPGRTAGSIEEFAISTARLRSALVDQGVAYLAKMFPAFRSEDRFGTNLIGEPVQLDDLSGYYIITMRPDSPREAEAQLRSLPEVEYVGRPQPRALLTPCLPESEDLYFNLQWWLHNTGQFLCDQNPLYPWPALVADADINAPEAWCITTGDSSVRVGIIDTGILATHLDFGGRVNLAHGVSFVPVEPPPPPPPPTCPLGCNSDGPVDCSFVPSPSNQPEDQLGHGTAVAGIVAATGNNDIGVASVAWGVTPIAINIFQCNSLSQSCLSARALDWARTQSIPILNMSYGWMALDVDPAERAAARNGFYSGQLLVSGMNNINASIPSYPAAYRNTVCAVGAFFGNGRRWYESPTRGSNWGSWIDLAAPGGNLIATTQWGCRQSNSTYFDLAGCGIPVSGNDFGGTSAAGPVVSGVAALILSKYPGLLGEDMYQGMIRTARHPDPEGEDTEVRVFDDSTHLFFDDSVGYGHVRADAALNYFAAPKAIFHQRVTGLSVVAIDTSQRVLLNFGIPDGTYTVVRYRLRKAVSFDTTFVATPAVWTRSSGSAGVEDLSPYDKEVEVLWGRIDSLSSTGCVVETNVFKILYLPPLSARAWYPTIPQFAAVAMTIVGVPGDGEGESLGEEPVRDAGAGGEARLPTVFRLRQNQPNPFSARTTIHFDLPVETIVRLEIFDAQGRLVRTLANQYFSAGFHGVEWDQRAERDRHVGAGVYLFRIHAGTFRDQKKMVLLPR